MDKGYIPTTLVPGINWAKLEPIRYTPEMIPHVWGALAPMLERSLRHARGTMVLDEFREMLLDGSATCFATVKEARIELMLVILPVDYATYRVARILACSGKGLKEASQFLDALEAWALTQGCVEIEGWCRPAMVRLTQRLGWQPKFTIVSRNLRGKLQ